MFSRLDPAAVEGAVWLANPDTRPQLMQLKYDDTAGQLMPVFLPGGNLSGKPFSTLLGLPIKFTFAAPQLGEPWRPVSGESEKLPFRREVFRAPDGRINSLLL